MFHFKNTLELTSMKQQRDENKMQRVSEGGLHIEISELQELGSSTSLLELPLQGEDRP